jgi:hypothetical protein
MARHRRDYGPRRDDSASRSFVIIEDRILQSDTYKAAFDYAVRTLLARFRTLPNPRTHEAESVAAARAAGGASEMAKEAIHRAIARIPYAKEPSPGMWKMTVEDVLLRNYAQVREQAKELYRREVWPEQYR